MNAASIALMYTISSTRLYVRKHIGSERGASAVEYGLLVALIAVVIAAAVLLLGGNLSGIFGNTANCVGNGSAAPSTSNCH